jgi:hypothetical protein
MATGDACASILALDMILPSAKFFYKSCSEREQAIRLPEGIQAQAFIAAAQL